MLDQPFGYHGPAKLRHTAITGCFWCSCWPEPQRSSATSCGTVGQLRLGSSCAVLELTQEHGIPLALPASCLLPRNLPEVQAGGQRLEDFECWSSHPQSSAAWRHLEKEATTIKKPFT